MDIFICLDGDGFIGGASRSLEGAKSLAGRESGATIEWHDSPLGGATATIDRGSGWGPQHWATIDRRTLVD